MTLFSSCFSIIFSLHSHTFSLSYNLLWSLTHTFSLILLSSLPQFTQPTGDHPC